MCMCMCMCMCVLCIDTSHLDIPIDAQTLAMWEAEMENANNLLDLNLEDDDW
jgi:hypothetical protein